MTLTELVAVSAVFCVLAGLVFQTFRYDSQSFSRQTSQNATQSKLRIWAGRMQQQMRAACFDPTDSNPNPYVITTASAQEVRFTTSATPSSAGYRLNGTDLELWSGGSSWRVVLQNVTTLAFTYYDAQGAQLDPTASGFTTKSISEIEATIVARAASSGYPGAAAPTVAEHMRAQLRNQCG